MKLLTLNCHSWFEEDQEEKMKIIARTIKEQDYDVISLQEVNQSIKKKILFDNIREDNFALALLKELEELGCNGYNVVWEICHICYGVYEEGVSIITKHKIIEEDTFSTFLSSNKNKESVKTRKALRVSIKIDEESIDFYSCHLGWWQDKEDPFKRQVDNLANSMRKDRLTFLMGDFNNDAFTREEGYDYLREKGLMDTFFMAKEKDNGITVKGKIAGWSSNEKHLRIDLILANKNIDVEYSRVIFNGENYPVVSDHYGVESVFKP
ncbi:endonuclease/exonuclease/phosphatase family protein [Clostridium vincentii]|uniref:Maltose 6'-phosphate phosphatase n=1 Tax=Clostridium vincentii TaxID=52704 RepID=A0A2T0BFR0_9CLOT|nr:endonuclease/exonuclease/phosphatase family protein [Clostridium vincentii]PRR82725.1 Maltose 6'-phosphate phosphatase [Clostridium vincentii]